MCIATVYVDSGGHREQVMSEVARLEAEEGGFLLIGLLGEQKRLQGKLKSIDFLEGHSVLIEQG
ncbi:CooT family nickel-binding protein [Chloroflexota bacterium]